MMEHLKAAETRWVPEKGQRKVAVTGLAHWMERQMAEWKQLVHWKVRLTVAVKVWVQLMEQQTVALTMWVLEMG